MADSLGQFWKEKLPSPHHVCPQDMWEPTRSAAITCMGAAPSCAWATTRVVQAHHLLRNAEEEPCLWPGTTGTDQQHGQTTPSMHHESSPPLYTKSMILNL